jgi:hypothetical protein
MKLVWSKTGDFINCEPVDAGFVEYWLDNQNNIVWQNTSCCPQQELLDELNSLLELVDKQLSKLKIKLIDYPITVEQDQLNELHKNWVLLFMKHKNLNNLFGIEFKIKMDRINKGLHDLERSWNFFLENDHNYFKTEYPLPNSFGNANIKIPCETLGRSYYNKWSNFDNDIGNDTNDFQEMYFKIFVNLNRSYTHPTPLQYENWCNTRNLSPTPESLLLANFIDLPDKINLYRALFMKNFVLQNNDVIFTT